MQITKKVLTTLSLLSLATFAQKPNIVVLFSDDAGYADFGFQPNVAAEMKSLTPNIDKIATQGARFSNAYMSGSVCSPSRAGLFTSRYQQRFGFDNNLPPGTKNGVSLNEKFGNHLLKPLGYKTGLIGKWHLGYPQEFHPNKRGFDWFYGLLQGSRPYFPIKSPSHYRVILENETPTEESDYVTDRFGDAACRFIKENKEQPFFLFVSFTTPHAPLQPKESDLNKLESIKEKQRKNYAGLILSLDDNVGKILTCLEEHGLDKNTIVVFTNDNGGQTQTGAVNTPLAGKKGTLLEGGVRVPMAMRWPGQIKPGTVINDPVISLDLFPTFTSAAGGKVDEALKLDGISILDRITGKSESLPTRPLFWRQGGKTGSRAVRMGNYKLYHDRKSNAEPALYDLTKDIGETTDLAASNPDKVKELLTLLDNWESELMDPLWGTKNAGKVNKKKIKQKKE